MYLKRVTVKCGFCSRSIIESFFFENEQGESDTVNDDRYRAMFQQDGATCHTAEATLDVCALFWKIAFSAAELMSFGHIGAAI